VFNSDDLCTLRWDSTAQAVEIIDQTLLPHTLRWCHLDSLPAFCHAISVMQVRGAPLIGITAAYGLACALTEDASDEGLSRASDTLLATRPTAVNLRWALAEIVRTVAGLPAEQRAATALSRAHQLRADDIAHCASIGENGLALIRQLQPRGDVLNIMTHCNAGWLATIQWGTALSPVYKAREAGLDVHVWVSETRPRNQGMNLSAWELQRAGVPCTVVADNSCGHLMQEGLVDCVIVGSDRTASNGDVCNKVGTYLKALAAQANDIPFYVALPESTIDWDCASGAQIPIEERDVMELLSITGRQANGELHEVSLAAPGTRAFNPAFDVTPSSLVSALITEQGSCQATVAGLKELFGR
jgi:methylthioribose-1-phosphate isomerase